MNVLLLAPLIEEQDYLRFALRHAGFQVSVVTHADAAVDHLRENHVDVVVAAVGGVEIGRKTTTAIRQQTRLPLLLITNALNIDDQCELLDLQVDVLIGRPFSPRILIRYVSMLMRRSGSVPMTMLSPIEGQGITLDPSNRTVIIGDYIGHLTQLEFRLLYVLMSNSGQVIPVDELVERVWGYEEAGNRDLVRGLIRRVRRKIEPANSKPYFIHNLPGIGYRFSPDADS